MLGNISVPGRPTNVDNSVEIGAGGVLFYIFSLVYLSLFLLPLWKTARYRLKYCLKGPLNPKQPTKLPSLMGSSVFDFRVNSEECLCLQTGSHKNCLSFERKCVCWGGGGGGLYTRTPQSPFGMSSVSCCQFIYMFFFLLVLRVGYGI